MLVAIGEFPIEFLEVRKQEVSMIIYESFL